jgi:hypothetical protein
MHRNSKERHMIFPKLILASLILLIGGAAVWLGLRRLGDLAAPRRAGLACLRGLAVVLIAAAALNPEWLRTSAESRPAPVLLAFDHSASMDLPDMDRGATRRQTLDARLLGRGGLLDRWADKRPVEVYRFADLLLPLAARALPPSVDTTDVRVALQQLQAEAARSRAAAIVLLSDGVDTEGLTAAEAGRIAGGLPPVFAVPVGGRSPLANRAVLGLRCPRQAPSGKTFECTAAVSSPAEAGKTLDITWAASDGQHGAVGVHLGADGSGSATWPVAAGRPGKLRVSVGVERAPGEFSAEDNTRAAMVDVVAGERRLVYLDSAPRPELSSLRRLLDRLEEVKLSLGVRKATGEWSQEQPSLKRVGEASAVEAFPAATVYILGDLPADAMKPSAWEALDRRVAGGEAAMLVLGGPRSVQLPRQLRGRLPAQVTGYQQRAASLAAPPPGSPLHEPGLRWSELPALAGINVLGPPVPGAIVALRAADGSPLIVLRDDTVRSAIVATDSMNRLVFSASATDASRDAYNHIWLKLLAWMLRPRPPRPITLAAERLTVLAGEPIAVEAETTAAVEAATLEFSGPQPRRMSMQRRAPGLFRVEAPPPAPGRHALVGRALAGGRELGRDQLVLDVVEQSREWRRPGPYLPILQAVADVTGGRVLAWDDLDRLPDLLPRGAENLTRTHRFSPARGVIAGAALLLVLMADWLLRRRWGLI